jgi:hypothetical protein
MGGGEGLRAPEPRLAGYVADRAEDVEGDVAGRDSPSRGVEGPDAERQVVEQKRPLDLPRGRAMGSNTTGANT